MNPIGDRMNPNSAQPLALYARVSQLGGRTLDDLRSVEMQRAEATAAARALGYEIDAEALFEDLDVSGVSGIADRPGLSAALAGVETGRFGGLALAWQSRADRSGGRILEELQAQIRAASAVLIIADAPSANVFPGVEAASGYLALPQHLRAVIDRAQREDATKRFAESRRGAIARGRKIGRPLLGYRQGKDGLVIDAAEAAIVREAFHRKAAGASYAAVARFLTETGLRPPSREADVDGWSHSTVRQMLLNETYLGVVWHGEYRNENAHEAIVTRAEFDAARVGRCAARPTGKTSDGALLVGVARCAGCGRTLRVRTRTRKDGSVVRAYYCVDAASETCADRAYVHVDKLDAHVEAFFLDALRADGRYAEAVEAEEQTVEARRLVEEAERELHAFVTTATALDAAYFSAGVEARQGRLDMARAALAEATSRTKRIGPVGGNLVDLYEGLDATARRKVLGGYLDRVVVRRGAGRAGLAGLAGHVQIVWYGNVVADRPEDAVATLA
jgi:DNA invertase Pin-like site-specific DNA recombinase